MHDMYDIGDLKNRPDELYDWAIKFDALIGPCYDPDGAEIWQVLRKIHNSLWGNLPQVVMIDMRDPDEIP